MSLIFSHVYDAALPSGHVVSGADNATVVDQTGQIVAAAGAARITHDYGTGADPRLLLEPACTQFIVGPTSLNASSWGIVFGLTKTQLAQDSVFTPCSFTSDGSSGARVRNTLSPALSLTAGQRFAVSLIYATTVAVPEVVFRILSSNGRMDFGDLFSAAPTATQQSGTGLSAIRVQVTDLGSGKRKFDAVLEANASTTVSTAQIRFETGHSAGDTFTVYGANLTNLSYPTSFVTANSRTADAYTPFDLPSSIANAGSLVAAIKIPQLDQSLVSSILSVQDGASTANRAALVYDGAAATLTAHYVLSDVVQTAGLSQAAQSAASTVAFAFAPNDFAVSFNGAAVLTHSTGDVAALSRAQVSNDIPLEIYSLRFYDERLPNSILIAPDTPDKDIAPPGQVIAWAASPQVAAVPPKSLSLVDISILISAAPQLTAAQTRALEVGAIDILVSAVPQIAVTAPVLRSIAISNKQIVWNASPRLGGDLVLPRIYAPTPRLTVIAAQRAKRSLIPRP